MKYKQCEAWVPVDNFVLEDNALTAVRSTDNILVIAGPGAGKTELLAQRACYLLETNSCQAPRKILAISFKRDAAENLAERVKMRVDDMLSQRFLSLTYDAFAKLLVDQFRHGLPKAYRLGANYSIDTSKLSTPIMAAFEMELPGCTQGPSSKARRIIRTRLLESISGPPYPLEGDALAMNTLSELLTGPGRSVVNFSILSRLAHYLLCSNPTIVSYLQHTYSHVFLDEFQDTTGRQYDLLMTAFGGSSCVLTAVGDPKQRIMLWAGAMPGVFTSYMDDFHAQEVPLLKNFRSAPRLIELQNILAANLLGSEVTCTPGKERPQEEGIASFIMFDDYEQEASEIAKLVYDLIHDNGLDPREICLLYKQQPDHFGEKMLEVMAATGISARVENEFQDLMIEPVVQFVVNTLRGACGEDEKQARENALYDYCRFEQHQSDYAVLQEELKMRRRLKLLKKTIDEATEWPIIEAAVKELIEEITFPKFCAVYPQYNELAFFTKRLQQCLDYMRDRYAIHGDVLKALRDFLGEDSVPLMTIHKSKGLEFEVVFFIGFEDQTFWNYHREPTEDARAFFVALSRAKERMYFTFSGKRINSWNEPERRGIQQIVPIFNTLVESKLVSGDDRRTEK